MSDESPPAPFLLRHWRWVLGIIGSTFLGGAALIIWLFSNFPRAEAYQHHITESASIHESLTKGQAVLEVKQARAEENHLGMKDDLAEMKLELRDIKSLVRQVLFGQRVDSALGAGPRGMRGR